MTFTFSYSFKKATQLLVTTAVMFQLAGCGDKDAEQRQAFTNFIKNEVMHSGVQLPALSEHQKKSFGNYAGDYAILYGFSQQLTRALNDGIRPVTDQLAGIHTAQDYLSARNDLRQAGGALRVVSQQIQNARNLADSSKTSLKLPESLQPVYQAAYDKVVSQPADRLQPILPELQVLTQSVLAVADFLQAQDTKVSYQNNGVQFPTQPQVTQYNHLIADVAAHEQALQQSRSVLQQLQ